MSDYDYDIDENQDRGQRSARRRRRSRYERPRTYISWTVLIMGLILGVLNGVNIAWNIAPIEEFDTAPRQLNTSAKHQYVIAIMLEYNLTADLPTAIQRLSELNLGGGDPIQSVADIACDLASTGYVNNTSGIREVRAMINFYQPQGRSGCAEEILPVTNIEGSFVEEIVVPTATVSLVSTKTPTPIGPDVPTPTPFVPTLPSNITTSSFDLIDLRTFCSPDISGVIEVRVQEFDGDPFPGQPVRVRWNGGDNTFYTGLKPERGLGYADYQMEDGVQYTIDMPNLADPFPTPLGATPCNYEGGTAITSYRVVFRQN